MKQFEKLSTKKIKLFCLPYAGGAASMYDQWSAKLSKEIDVCPINLAGRGSRITDKLYENLAAAVEDIYQMIKDDMG